MRPQRLLIVMGVAFATLAGCGGPFGCGVREVSDGRAEYSQQRLPAPVSAEASRFSNAEKEMSELKQTIIQHHIAFSRSRGTRDPLDSGQLSTARAAGLGSIERLEELCNEILADSSLVSSVSGADSTTRDYLDFARQKRAEFGGD